MAATNIRGRQSVFLVRWQPRPQGLLEKTRLGTRLVHWFCFYSSPWSTVLSIIFQYLMVVCATIFLRSFADEVNRQSTDKLSLYICFS